MKIIRFLLALVVATTLNVVGAAQVQPVVRAERTSFTLFQDVSTGATMAQVDFWFSVTVPTGNGDMYFSTWLRDSQVENPAAAGMPGAHTWAARPESTADPVLMGAVIIPHEGVYNNVRGVLKIPESRTGKFQVSTLFGAQPGEIGLAGIELTGIAWGYVPGDLSRFVDPNLKSELFFIQGGAAVPEPTSVGMGLLSLIGLLYHVRRKSAK